MDLEKTVTIDKLLDIAGELASEHSENGEYDRALTEMVVDAANLSMESRDYVQSLIRERNARHYRRDMV